jgi:hypothetical protein
VTWPTVVVTLMLPSGEKPPLLVLVTLVLPSGETPPLLVPVTSLAYLETSRTVLPLSEMLPVVVVKRQAGMET